MSNQPTPTQNDTLAKLREQVAAQRAAILAQLPARKDESSPKTRKGRQQAARANYAEFSQAAHALARVVGGEEQKDGDADLLTMLESAPNVQNDNGRYVGKFVTVSDDGYTVTVSEFTIKAKALLSGNLVVRPEFVEKETKTLWAEVK